VASDLLSIYLNDHLAGATAGVELARRSRGSNEGTPLGDFLDGLAEDIEADRKELERLMEELGISRDRFKAAGAYVLEKLGRMKANGQLTGYSPLSRLIELEMLHVGITGKLEMWSAVREVLGGRLRSFDFERLIERAETQRSSLEEHRLAAAREAFGESSVVKAWEANASASARA
jgi:hypothetical protein